MEARTVLDSELHAYRQKVLDDQIANYVRSGYYVVSGGRASKSGSGKAGS